MKQGLRQPGVGEQQEILRSYIEFEYVWMQW